MKKQLNQVAEFNEAYEVTHRNKPGLQPLKTARQRFYLLIEEIDEFDEAIHNKDLIEIADALADIQYILLGAVHEYGLQDKFEAIFSEVHRSNMDKLHDGKIVKNERNKVVKPKGWKAPDLKTIIEA